MEKFNEKIEEQATKLLKQAEIEEEKSLLLLTPHAREIAITKRLKERGIISPRRHRRVIEEREFGYAEHTDDNGNTSDLLDWMNGHASAEDDFWLREDVQEVTTNIYEWNPTLADYDFVLQNIEDRVLHAMLRKKRDRIPPDLVLAYHLVYRRRYSKSETAKRMGISNATVSKYLDLFFREIALELYCGIEINDKTLEKYMHPSIITLKNARKKYGKKRQKTGTE